MHVLLGDGVGSLVVGSLVVGGGSVVGVEPALVVGVEAGVVPA